VSTPTVHDDWGPPANLFGPTGRFLTLPVAADAARLVEWVREFAPSSILIYPSTLRAFIDYCRDTGIEIPSLTHIRTVGETLSLSIRTDAQAAFKAKVTDCYSSQELGYMALQCPESGLYHTMAEGILAEVLNDSGEPCAEGEIGRVTVTDLHNFATPLVRYDIGDFAEVGPRCPCGRGFPTWTRIVGRERNLVLMPDGSRHWPVTGFIRCRDVAPILQYQLVQRSRDAIDARLVVERTLSIAEEDHLRELFHSCIGYPFRLQLSYVDGRIPHGPSGKFDEFVCEVADVA
jgi:phenylacetate-CoA ligase